MRSDRRRRPKERSLRRVWLSTVMTFSAVVVVLIAATVAVTQYERSTFFETTRALESETAALLALERAALESTGPMSLMLYRVGSPEELEGADESYGRARLKVAREFDRVAEALHTGNEKQLLDRARADWETADAAVLGAEEAYTDEELLKLVSSGGDPFRASVWAPLGEMDFAMSDVRTETVADLREQLADANSAQDLLTLVFVITVIAGVGTMVIAVRRMSHQVLHPLSEVDRGVRSMRETEQPAPIEVHGAVTEVGRLVDTLNETAMSLRMSHELLQTQASTDGLTTLPNRTAFTEELRAILNDPSGGPVTVMFIDVDDFKDINDTMGHAAGDELLQIIARRLRSSIRAQEVVARLGGDEFAIAGHVGDDASAAMRAAERVLQTLEAPLQIAGTQLHVGCSIGIAISEPDAGVEDAPHLLANADFAMYMAKSHGKNRYELHSPALHDEMLARMELRRDLAAALTEDQFELHYQPVIDLETNELTGFEALIRWQHPSLGLLSPAQFIHIAEDTGSIIGIGAWVLDRACATLAELHRDDDRLMMNVNVSPQQLTKSDLMTTVVDALRTHGITPDRLVLEITEATAMTNTAEGIEQLEALRRHGVHVALDDFGTGFSSLRYLGDLPADVIKIDRSFVVGRSANQASTLESIITLAQRLGLEIVAEGIETQEDLDRLRGFGQISGQGYLLARPMPVTDLPAFRRGHSPTRAPTRTTASR